MVSRVGGRAAEKHSELLGKIREANSKFYNAQSAIEDAKRMIDACELRLASGTQNKAEIKLCHENIREGQRTIDKQTRIMNDAQSKGSRCRGEIRDYCDIIDCEETH